jgi:AcrR family transcriptional regulator
VKRPTLPRRRRKAKPFAQAVPARAKSLLRQRKHDVVRLALCAAAEKLFLSRGFEGTTIEEIAHGAGVSRRSFFRYYESKEDVLVERSGRGSERLYAELVARPHQEPVMVALRKALAAAMQTSIEDGDFVRWLIRSLREDRRVRRAVMERGMRLEERIAGLFSRRLRSRANDPTPMLLAFVARAMLDTAINTWYDHEPDDVAGLVDGLVESLRAVVTEAPPAPPRPAKKRAIVRHARMRKGRRP